jgi:hypothetical protein
MFYLCVCVEIAVNMGIPEFVIGTLKFIPAMDSIASMENGVFSFFEQAMLASLLRARAHSSQLYDPP